VRGISRLVDWLRTPWGGEVIRNRVIRFVYAVLSLVCSEVVSANESQDALALAVSAYESGDYNAALQHAELCLHIEANPRCDLEAAKARFQLGEFDAARDTVTTLLNQRNTDPDLIYRIYNISGSLFLKRGRYEKALKAFEQALPHAKNTGVVRDAVRIMNNIGVTAQYVEDAPLAEAIFAELLSTYGAVVDDYQRASLMSNYADALMTQDKLSQALSIHKEALQLRESIELPIEIALSHRSISHIYRETEQHEQALAHLEKAMSIERQQGLKNALLSTQAGYIDTLNRVGRFDEAIRIGEDALITVKDQGLDGLLPDYYNQLSIAYQGAQQFPKALKYSRLALQSEVRLSTESSRVQLADLKAQVEVSEAKAETETLRAVEFQTALALEQQNQRVNVLQLILALGTFSLILGAWQYSLLRKRQHALRQANADLDGALSRIDTLEGILPLCMHCRRIRDEDHDPEHWLELENFVYLRTKAQVSHGICPDCLPIHYPSSGTP